MKLLKKLNDSLLKEDAAGGAVGGGAVAGFAMPLFKTVIKRPIDNVSPQKVKKNRKQKRLKETFLKLKEQATPLSHSSDIDTTGVIAKLKSLQNKETTPQQNLVSFGLEDEHGNVIKITVKQEQAENFERALNRFLSDQDKEHGLEIADILFRLKDHFDIINVDWPDVVEDEAEEQKLNIPSEKDQVQEPSQTADLEAPAPSESDEKQASSMLMQVIDMMKADADARKAEAIARQKEAEARVTKAAAEQALAKVKQEEQILDMEAWEKQKKEEEKEAKRLAKLARWKHEIEKEKGVSLDDFEPTELKKDNLLKVEPEIEDKESVEGELEKKPFKGPEEEETSKERQTQPNYQHLKNKLELLQKQKGKQNVDDLIAAARERARRYELIGREHYQDEEHNRLQKEPNKSYNVAPFIMLKGIK